MIAPLFGNTAVIKFCNSEILFSSSTSLSPLMDFFLFADMHFEG